MQKQNITNQDFLYFLAGILALGVRLLNIGAFSLNDFEAGWALQALDLSRGVLELPGPHAAYINLTGLLFSIFGSSEALARLVPALVGSLMVLAPLALRDRLGRSGALILAFGLALDPGLVSLSRQAGGPMMAIAFALLAISLAYARKPAWSGICAGMALLSGASIWLGILGLLMALGLSKLTRLSLEAGSTSGTEASQTSSTSWRLGLSFALGTLLIVGSLFSFFPAGLGAWASSLTAFFAGWAQPSGIPLLKPVVALIVYSPLALIFAPVALIQEWRRERSLVLMSGLWFLAALALVLIYPGRQVGDAAWAIVPLWILAARAISNNLDQQSTNLVSLGQAAAVSLLAALAWLTLAGLRFTVGGAQSLHWLLILGLIVLAGLSAGFIGLGWSWNLARNGSVLGVVVALGIYGFAVMVGATQWRQSSPAELWTPLPGAASNRLLSDTLRQLSLSSTGEEKTLQVVSLVESHSLRWLLRDYPQASFAQALPEMNLPQAIITDQDAEEMAWAATYRGQDFAWQTYPAWWNVLPPDRIEWLVSRQAPLETELIILWGRSDLFPDEWAPVSEDNQKLLDAPAADDGGR
jgi:hypothetical protein